MGWTSIDDMVNKITSGKTYRTDFSKSIAGIEQQLLVDGMITLCYQL